jgi:hypothetical protein
MAMDLWAVVGALGAAFAQAAWTDSIVSRRASTPPRRIVNLHRIPGLNVTIFAGCRSKGSPVPAARHRKEQCDLPRSFGSAPRRE